MISEESRNNSTLDYKQIYRNLKRKLKLLIYVISSAFVNSIFDYN